jgi:hypothetical protein
MARQAPIVVFLLSGLLIAVVAGFVGLVAGIVINKDWKIDPTSSLVYMWFVILALVAVLKRVTDRFIDTMFQQESDDERFKRLIGEVLKERNSGSEIQPEPSD